MCFCQNCSLKSKCEQVCKEVESYLKSMQNYKTTYVNKEIGVSEVSMEQSSYQKWKRPTRNRDRNHDHKTWMTIINIVQTKLTKKQRQIVWMYLEGLSMAEIGRRQNISGQAVRYALFGHPKQGGGIVRKIQKLLVIN